jgi:excisionase family DNA binding protein
VTVPAFAEDLSVRDKIVRKWIRAGVLPAYRFAGQWRIAVEDAAAFIERRRF